MYSLVPSHSVTEFCNFSNPCFASCSPATSEIRRSFINPTFESPTAFAVRLNPSQTCTCLNAHDIDASTRSSPPQFWAASCTTKLPLKRTPCGEMSLLQSCERDRRTICTQIGLPEGHNSKPPMQLDSRRCSSFLAFYRRRRSASSAGAFLSRDPLGLVERVTEVLPLESFHQDAVAAHWRGCGPWVCLKNCKRHSLHALQTASTSRTTWMPVRTAARCCTVQCLHQACHVACRAQWPEGRGALAAETGRAERRSVVNWTSAAGALHKFRDGSCGLADRGVHERLRRATIVARHTAGNHR
jgi:hypothetical protein